MSKVKITGNASGTGTVTIAAPNTNTDRTLTLPDGAGEILLSDGDGSSLTGVGKVLQVVEGTLGTQVGSTATSFTSLFSASITPSSTSNKIVAICSVPIYCTTGGGSFLSIFRGSTELSSNSLSRGFSQTTLQGYWGAPTVATFLDSPSTTSSTTYSVQFKTNGTTVYYGQDGSGKLATLLLMEIAG